MRNLKLRLLTRALEQTGGSQKDATQALGLPHDRSTSCANTNSSGVLDMAHFMVNFPIELYGPNCTKGALMNRRKVPWGLVLFAGLVVVPGADGHEEKKYLGWEHKWGVGSAYSSEQDDCLVRYNRVEGLFLGAREPLSYHTDHTGQGFAGYGHLGYGFGAREWQYQVGIEEFSFHGSPRSLSSIGAELHDVTTSQDTWLLSAEENSLYAALFRRDFFDYYQRRGWSVYTIHDYAGLVHLTARWSQDEFSSLDSQVDWIPVGNRLARKTFRVNPAVDEGKANSLRLDIQVDNRDHRRWHRREWLVNSMVEQGGGRLGGDFTFRRVLLEMRRYLEDGESELDLRLRLGRGSGELPRQYLYNLGGYSTLRGYPHKAFSGDRMALLNIEYWHDDIGVLFDTGAVWFSHEGAQRALEWGAIEPDEQAHFKRSLGFAGRIDDDFQIGLARPLDGPEEDWRYFVRCSRTF